ncbi:winged helix-turn-helix transcriptional regulator [Natronorubrum sp. FCH18a]|uniref:winged helix-turn-helix transcriptional regulator n=1 Tax=Natronorubrum sp. FCH18a TaxID=3447018 RepID=UPI003F51028C
MSNSAHTSSNVEQPMPRAIIHKKILDAAKAEPTASPAELATAVSSASKNLVEDVLEEYGDPVEETTHETEEQDDNLEPSLSDSTDSGSAIENKSEPEPADPTIELADLTDSQRETFEAIYENPDATQRELADHLDVSSAAVNKRVNGINGFEWNARREFVTALFDNNDNDDNDSGDDNGGQLPTTIEPESRLLQQLSERVVTLSERVEALEQSSQETPRDRCSIGNDSELTHKIVHACMESNRITEEEELDILKQVIDSSTCTDCI